MDDVHRLAEFARGAAAAVSRGWTDASAWFDRLDDTDLLWQVGLPLFVLWGALLMIPAPSDERTAGFWRAFAVSGRWIVLGASVAPVVVWAATRK